MTICGLCGKPVSEGKLDPTEIVLCKTCGDMLKGNFVFVVRCKDCKNRNDSLRCPLESLKKQFEYTKVFTYGVPDDWFCAYGERKES